MGQEIGILLGSKPTKVLSHWTETSALPCKTRPAEPRSEVRVHTHGFPRGSMILGGPGMSPDQMETFIKKL